MYPRDLAFLTNLSGESEYCSSSRADALSGVF
jgi:hypothetical protein